MTDWGGLPPNIAIWFEVVAGMAVGLALGSFATLLSYRAPRRQSVIWPRSRCAACKRTLGIRDLVPVFSWLFLRGCCRRCGVRISVRYPVIELVTALGTLALFVILGLHIALLPALVAWVAIVSLVTIRIERSDP